MKRMRDLAGTGRRAGLALAALALAGAAPAVAQTEDYLVVDNIEEEWVNLNLPSIRPMFFWDVAELYAVNTHDSTVSLFNDTSGIPATTHRTPWGPVSLSGWTDPAALSSSGEQLLVVCSGSYVLAFIDRHTGNTIHVMELPPEPRDILVDHETSQAYISCAAQDLVVEVDLTTRTITRQWQIASKNPISLDFDKDGNVLVAPLFSGNNSAIHKEAGQFIGLEAGVRGILDLADPTIAAPPGLPDEDCFRVVRSTGAVEPIARGMMTIVLAQGVNPDSGQLWQVGTDANNKDPNRQSEPLINGDIVRNVVAIADVPNVGNPPSTPVAVIDLDDSDTNTSGVQYDPSRTVGQPNGLHFSDNGFAFISGLLTDNVTLLNPAGKFVLEWDVPEGSIPRQVLYSPTFNLVFVYCWGTNKIESYTLTANPQPFVTLDLGHDPTPALVQEGRKVFYSAHKSLNNNASCASCHVEGKADNIAWNLSDDEKDGKGPMFTQVLSGIDRLFPFHWRGERPGLIDFNPAFSGLLGSQTGDLDTTPGGEFDQFEAFVLSMRNPPNPNQDKTRVISDAINAPKAPGPPTGTRRTARGCGSSTPPSTARCATTSPCRPATTSRGTTWATRTRASSGSWSRPSTRSTASRWTRTR